MLPFSYYYQAVIVPASICVPISVAAFNFSNTYRPMRIVLLYLIVSGSINLIAILNSHSNNLPLLHLYTVVEFVLLMLYFISINNNRQVLNVSYILMAVFPVLCIINVIFFQSKFQYNSYVRPVEGIILIGYCFLYFYNSTEVEMTDTWASKPFNWVNTGILLYFSCSLFLFIFSNVIHLTLSREAKTFMLNLHDTLVLIMYILFAIGFSKCKRSPTISMS